MQEEVESSIQQYPSEILKQKHLNEHWIDNMGANTAAADSLPVTSRSGMKDARR